MGTRAHASFISVQAPAFGPRIDGASPGHSAVSYFRWWGLSLTLPEESGAQEEGSRSCFLGPGQS